MKTAGARNSSRANLREPVNISVFRQHMLLKLMTGLEPVSLRLGVLKPRHARAGELDPAILEPRTLERFRQIFARSYRDETPENRVKKLFQGLDLPDNFLLLNGSGLYHHLTYGSVSAVEGDVTYVHVDNHSDDREEPDGTLTHAGFVDSISALENVENVLLYGSETDKYACFREKENLVERVENQRIYISVDLDIISETHLGSPYSQGDLEIQELLDLIDALKREAGVVAGDLVGMERPVREKDEKTYIRCAEAMRKNL
jgi:arginase family enzyme